MRNNIFDAPIPGQSLTMDKGSTPVEYPPQYADINDALEYLFDRMSTKKQVVRLVLMLKKGTPVEFIARAILFQGFTSGKWTPDAALLMLRVVMAMIIAIASNAGVKNPTILNPDKAQNEFLDQFVDEDMDEGEGAEEEEVEDAKESLPKFSGILGSID